MGKINSKAKGKRYELEIANYLKERGYKARRTAQYCGNTGDASDVVGLPGIHIECKHQEQFHIYDWMKQAENDSKKSGNLPSVFFRKNNQKTIVCLPIDAFLKLYDAYSEVQYGTTKK
jgi:Holliday junction resolvase